MKCTSCGKKLTETSEMFIRLCRRCYNPSTGRVSKKLIFGEQSE